MRWQQVSLIGVGLLGGSLGLALKQRGLARRVVGFVRRPESVEECQRMGAVDQALLDLSAATEGADLVIFCTPIAQMRELGALMARTLRPGTLLTDVGSVKVSVVQELEPLAAAARSVFIGSHPMAGAERMGVSAARPDLFVNSVCVITPTSNSPSEHVQQLESLWASLGGRPLRLTPEVHDELVSRSSHLPHLLAAALANDVLSPAHPPEQSLLCANGFRDSTRIASSSPEMWRDICLANRKNLCRVLGVFVEDLKELQLALENADGKAIQHFFDQAKQRRDAWTRHPTSSSPE